MLNLYNYSKISICKALDLNLYNCQVLKCSKFKEIFRSFSKKQSLEMKYLNVAEKNDAAKTIAGLLSNGRARRREGYSVYNKIYEFEGEVKGKKCTMIMTSVSGHLMTHAFSLSYRNWNNVDPLSLFDAPIHKQVPEDFQPIKRTLEREVKGCQGLIIWTDCDREGENIGFEIIDVCKAIKPNLTVYRANFSEITTTSVRRALRELTQPDQKKNEAVEVRSELDLRTGAAITRFQTLRLQKLFPVNISDKIISYGSCQIPTLGFVVERYKEVEAFVSEPFWKIKVLHTIEDLTVEFFWNRNRLFDKQAVEDYYLLCLSDPKAKVESVTVKPKSKWRPTPMDTVELEKLGSRKLKLSAKETMGIAEKLYTKGLISYPRTETNQFSKDFDLRTLVEEQTNHSVWGPFAQRVMEWGPNPRNGNKSDQAHPPIHPTKMVGSLDGNEGRVYELVCRHFLACVSKDAVGMETIVNIDIGGEKFHANGLAIHERNYLDVYIYDKWNVKLIHKYEQGQIFDPTEISMQEGATQAPPLLTEADLIALMEKHGIGTDATHAEHINTIKERGYIGVVNNGFLVPGVIGMGLYEGYSAMELALAKPVLRAEFENDLKKICNGEKDPKIVLREQVENYKKAYQQIVQKVTELDNTIAARLNETPSMANTNSTSGGSFENNPNYLQDIFLCSKCKKAKMALRMKKNQSGFFLGCTNFPECKHIIGLPSECKEVEIIDETCQLCGPSVKLLKVKFQNSYYKTLFNTPSGKYKLCLLCDSKFRNNFNILLESSNQSGAIVSNSYASSQNTFTSSSTSSTTIGSRPGNSSGPSSSQVRRGKNDNTKKKEPTTKKKKEPKQKTLTTASRKKNPIIQTDNALDEFFNDDDEFGDFIAEAENCERTASQSSTSSKQAQGSQILSENNVDAFFQDDDDIFTDIDLNAGNNQPSTSTSSSLNSHRRSVASTSNYNDSISTYFQDDDDDFAWGSANRKSTDQKYNKNQVASQVQNSRSTTHTSRPFASSNNLQDDDDDDYAWGSDGKKKMDLQYKNHHTSLVQEVRDNPQSRSFPSPSSFRSNAPNYLDDSITTIFRDGNDDSSDFSWGSAQRKKPRIDHENETSSNSHKPNEDYFWGSQMWKKAIKCETCSLPAKKLTVQKDGPNKGREFYVCSKPKGCKYFQWADEIDKNNGSQQFTSPSMSKASQNSSHQENVPNCNCEMPAKNLVVKKDGPNKGRPFYACSNQSSSCGFFQWGDEDKQPSTSSTSRSNKNSWDSFDTNENNIKCNCELPAKSLVAKKDGPNKGRSFYACPNQSSSCGFFQWADDDDQPSTSSKSGGSKNSWGSKKKKDPPLRGKKK